MLVTDGLFGFWVGNGYQDRGSTSREYRNCTPTTAPPEDGSVEGATHQPGLRDVPKVIRATILCMTDGVHLHRGPGQLPQALIGSLASEGAMGSGEIVEALPLMELCVEELGVVDNRAG